MGTLPFGGEGVLVTRLGPLHLHDHSHTCACEEDYGDQMMENSAGRKIMTCDVSHAREILVAMALIVQHIQ